MRPDSHIFCRRCREQEKPKSELFYALLSPFALSSFLFQGHYLVSDSVLLGKNERERAGLRVKSDSCSDSIFPIFVVPPPPPGSAPTSEFAFSTPCSSLFHVVPCSTLDKVTSFGATHTSLASNGIFPRVTAQISPLSSCVRALQRQNGTKTGSEAGSGGDHATQTPKTE